MKVSDAEKNGAGPLVGAVIISQGHLASEFLAAAEMIVGPMPHVTHASIDWHDDIDAAQAELERAINRVARGRGVLLLTDMFGGAPTDVASMFLDSELIEVISGVNLPMVLKLADQSGDEKLEDVARRVREAGKEGIHLAGELLTPQPKAS